MDIEKRIHDIVERFKIVNYQEELLESESQFISIKRGHYQLNNGKSIDRETIVKNVGTGCAAVVFAVTKEKKILVVVQPRVVLPTNTKINVELPAGYIEKDEESIEAAKRELLEETGYITQNIRKLDSYYPSLGVGSERIDLFMALDCEKKSIPHLDDDEFLDYEEVTLEEYEYLLKNSYMNGVNERMGYFYYLDYLKKADL